MDLLTIILAFLGAVAGGGAGSAAIQARQSGKDRELKLRADIRKEYLDLLAQAHGKPRDGRAGVGLVEEIGAIYMLQGLAVEHPWLRIPVFMALRNFSVSDDFHPDHRRAAGLAIELLNQLTKELVYRNGHPVTFLPLRWWFIRKRRRAGAPPANTERGDGAV